MVESEIALRWLDAFNRKDVDSLIELYADGAVHSSPKLRALDPRGDGQLSGKTAIAAWWRDSLARLPGLRYELDTLTCEPGMAVLEYVRLADDSDPLRVAEVFQIRNGKITRSRVYHG